MKIKTESNNKAKFLNVSEDGVFFSIQGEGNNMGELSCFLRLNGCNLKCIWCDTKYTWSDKKKTRWTCEQTKEIIENAWKCVNKNKSKRLVITGGEPLMQQEGIESLLKKMPEWNIEIETNGTIVPTKEILKRAQINCSPKLNNSGNPKELRIKDEVIKTLKDANTFFKFVAASSLDLDEIEKDFVDKFSIDINRIIIMPEGVNSEEIRANALKIVEGVKEKGYRLLGRLHCEIWGDKRRV